MSLRFEEISAENVDDLMSICGNMPGMDKNPHFVEGRKARRQWLLEMIEKFGTVGMLAYGVSGMAKGFVECLPASAHPLGTFSPDAKRTVTINCAWYRQDCEECGDEPVGLGIRKAILDEMFGTKFFDRLLGKKCRYVDVFTLKNAPIMQYEFYTEYGFKDAVELQGFPTTRYLLRYPMLGDKIEPRVDPVSFDIGDKKNVLTLGLYRQCHLSYMLAGKIKRAAEGLDGVTLNVVDYFDTGLPVLCEPTINGRPAFDTPVYFMEEEDIRESIRSKMM